VQATGLAKDGFCRACFDGIYPVPLPDEEYVGELLDPANAAPEVQPR